MRKKIELENVNLLKRQESRLPTLHGGKVLSFETIGKKVYAYVSGDLSEEEIANLKTAILGLPNDPLPNELTREEFIKSHLKKMTPAQIDTYVDENVKNIEDVKGLLKKMIRLINYTSSRVG